MQCLWFALLEIQIKAMAHSHNQFVYFASWQQLFIFLDQVNYLYVCSSLHCVNYLFKQLYTCGTDRQLILYMTTYALSLFFLEYEHEIIKPFNKFRQCTSKPYASWTFQWLQRDKRLRNMMVSEESCTMFGSSSVNHYCGQSHKQMHTWSQHLVGTTQPNKHLRMTNYESFQVIWCFSVSDESRPVAACPDKTQLMMSMPISLKNAML